jgi:hypothetical protein
MKRKTMNSVIQKKINDWLKHITDEELVKQLKNNIIVTGGCITSMLLNEDINDFDVYFKNQETVEMLTDYYCKEFRRLNPKDGINPTRTTDVETGRVKILIQSDGIVEESDSVADEVEFSVPEYVSAMSDLDQVPDNALEDDGKEKYRPVFLSGNAITLSNKVQLIIRFYGEPEEIHANYDFIHTTNYWESKSGQVTLNLRACEAIMNKELFYSGSRYPIASLIRTRKFLKRGWQINAGQYVKMAFQISELNMNDVNVLEDQLTGVDSTYFLWFIKEMKKKIEKDKDFQITRDYVITVIDKIFG